MVEVMTVIGSLTGVYSAYRALKGGRWLYKKAKGFKLFKRRKR